MQPLGRFLFFVFLLSLLSSFNLIRKSADAVQSPAHVKPISAVHKSLQQCLKQAEAHLITTQRTLGQTGHACVWACRCVSYHRSLQGSENPEFIAKSDPHTNTKQQWIQYVWCHAVRATERRYCGKDKTKKEICVPLWRGDKPDHLPD